MFVLCNNIGWVSREVLKTSTSRLGFQHLPRDPVNVNAKKNIFVPYNVYSCTSNCRHIVQHIKIGASIYMCIDISHVTNKISDTFECIDMGHRKEPMFTKLEFYIRSIFTKYSDFSSVFASLPNKSESVGYRSWCVFYFHFFLTNARTRRNNSRLGLLTQSLEYLPLTLSMHTSLRSYLEVRTQYHRTPKNSHTRKNIL